MDKMLINDSNLIICIGSVLAAYMLGSISSSILLCRLLKLPDPRSCGSKNPGTTNMLRFAGKKLAALVLCFDVLKGFIVVFIAHRLGLSNLEIAINAIAVFLGHLFPVFFNFAGGKGVATTLGIMLALSWKFALCCLGVWIMVFKITRVSSVAALAATLAAMFLAIGILFLHLDHWIQPEFAICIIFLSICVILKHRSNIYNLLHRVEGKV